MRVGVYLIMMTCSVDAVNLDGSALYVDGSEHTSSMRIVDDAAMGSHAQQSTKYLTVSTVGYGHHSNGVERSRMKFLYFRVGSYALFK